MSQIPPATGLLRTRQHFEILDGLRGIAAIAVVVFHFMEIAVPNVEDSLVTHTYLAVDFFFCLSGFVIAYAYDGRLPQIGVGTFLKLRLIRLHPLVIIGTVLGLIVFILDPFSQLWLKYADKLLLMFLAGCLMIPYPLVQERFFNLFHLNAPVWSLFWEYVANIVYALVLVRLAKKWLWVLAVISAAALFYESHRSGHLSVGWGGDNIRGGGFRVAWSFVAGILVYRMNWIIRNRLGFGMMAILLAVVFFIPFTKETAPWVDPLIAVFYLPLVVALGAGATLGKNTEGICRLSGNISYPLYMVHYPFIWVYFSYLEQAKPSQSTMFLIAGVGTLLLIGFAYLVWKYVDAPVRRYLTQRLAARQSKPARVTG